MKCAKDSAIYTSDEEAIFLAENSGSDPELALLGIHADRNENPRIKALWEGIEKKQNELGLRAISMLCGGMAVSISLLNEATFNYVLLVLMLSVAYKVVTDETPDFWSCFDEAVRNDKKLCFS